MYIAYVIFAAVFAIYMSKSTDRKFLGFVLLFWLLAEPVVKTQFSIPVPGLPIELQPGRLLFLFSLAYLFTAWFSGKKINPQAWKRYPFEKYLYIYLLFVVIALVVNRTYISSKSIVSVPLEIVTFITIYLLAKRYITDSIREKILKTIVIVASIAAAIAIIQLVISQPFFRVSPDQTRLAFGGLLRSTGIFQNEYEFGYFQILSIFVLLTSMRGRLWEYLLLGLLILSVVLTFHRMGYLILMICLFIYGIWFADRRYRIPLFAIGGLSTVLVLSLFFVFQSEIFGSDVVKQRFLDDTVTGRFKQYEVALKSMSDHPFGFGGYDNPEYENMMISNNLFIAYEKKYGVWGERALVVHNGYLAAGVKYGPLAMLMFLSLVVTMLLVAMKSIISTDRSSTLPFYATLIWALSNMTNSTNNFRIYFVLLVAIILGSYLGGRRKDL